jgi:hypothetical protein
MHHVQEYFEVRSCILYVIYTLVMNVLRQQTCKVGV